MTGELIPAIMQTLAYAFLVYIGLEFMIAGIGKLRADSDFDRIVYGYRLVPAAFVSTVATTLPFFEILAGLLLIVRLTAVPIVVLLFMFGIAMAINLARGRSEIECGCGSGGSISWKQVGRNLIAAVGVVLAIAAPGPYGLLVMAGIVLGLGAIGLRFLSTFIDANAQAAFRTRRQGHI